MNYTVLLHKEFEIPTLGSKFFKILKFVFLSEVAPKSFCVKFSGLKVRKYSTYRLIFGLFLKLKKFMVLQWRFQNYFASKTKKILLRYYFSQRHAIKNSSGQMRQISHMIEMIQPTIGWRRNERGTHKNTHGSWILWSVLRVRLRTMHSLFCITSWLSYITLCFIDSRFFFCPWKNRARFYETAASQPRVFARLLVGNN